MMEETEIGKVTHYFSKIRVAVLKLDAGLKIGDTIHIKGATTDFIHKIDSMQIDHNNIEEAKAGDDIGMKVPDAVREHDKVFLVTEVEGQEESGDEGEG